MLCLFIFLLVLPQLITGEDGPMVETSLGTVEGLFENSYNNKTYAAFYSIPYAEPFIGDLRFKPPVPAKPWCGILDAKTVKQCPQYHNGEYIGSEDCLVINVFAPILSLNTTQYEKLPVFVDIHAGAFMFGYGNDYGGAAYFMDRNAILVTLNYRLGPLGFLSTEDDVVPGNMGLKDQVMALKWVKDNIVYFGGDPNKVTIVGLSAGGASITYHYMSSLSTNLFRNGISKSGSALNPWAFQDKPLERTKRIANKVNCPFTSTKSLVKCLTNKPVKEIIDAVQETEYVWRGLPFSPFGPVVETNCNNDSFLCKHPYQILEDGELNPAPIMYTFTTAEGIYPSGEWLTNSSYLPHLDENWYEICPAIFDFEYTLSVKEQQILCQNIKSYYLKNKNVSMETFDELTKSMTDRLFTLGIENNAKLHAKYSPNVYVYRYNYTAIALPSFAILFSTEDKHGVCHGDDVVFTLSLYHKGLPRLKMDKSDLKMQAILFDFMETFAEFGVPFSLYISTNWKAMDSSGKLTYLHINNPDDITMKSADSVSNGNFWQQFNFEENEYYSWKKYINIK